MLDFTLANGITENSSDWAWPGVPYASSDAGYTVYRGSHHGNVSGSGDGVGVFEHNICHCFISGEIPDRQIACDALQV